ncbi:UNVERIFIED_CONTAM: hypothetical protein NY100_00745 [Prevotella sp. 15_C9]
MKRIVTLMRRCLQMSIRVFSQEPRFTEEIKNRINRYMRQLQ